MRPPRKEICDCGLLERFSRKPEHPIRFDEEMNEYFIACRNKGKISIYYCTFCGGTMPESRAESLFEFISNEEQRRIMRLFEAVATEKEVLARFGSPDHESTVGALVIQP